MERKWAHRRAEVQGGRPSFLVPRSSLTISAPPLRPEPEMRSERETRAGSYGPEGGTGCKRLRQPVRGRVAARLGQCRAESGFRVVSGRPRVPWGCGEWPRVAGPGCPRRVFPAWALRVGPPPWRQSPSTLTDSWVGNSESSGSVSLARVSLALEGGLDMVESLPKHGFFPSLWWCCDTSLPTITEGMRVLRQFLP